LAFDLVILAAVALSFNVFIGNFSFTLFGFVAGYVIVHVKDRGIVMFSLLALLFAWTCSISLGYNTPAMTSGILLATLLVVTYNRKYFPMQGKYKYGISILALAGLLFSFHYTRTHFIYKDNKASELTADLGTAFHGASKIKTNELNQLAFLELTQLSEKYQDSLAIVPDYAAFWVTSKFPNPLNIDWPNQGETQSPYFQEVILKHLLSQKGKITIAVQKYRASELQLGKNALEDEEIQFPIVQMVEENFIRIGETEFFYLYQ